MLPGRDADWPYHNGTGPQLRSRPSVMLESLGQKPDALALMWFGVEAPKAICS